MKDKWETKELEEIREEFEELFPKDKCAKLGLHPSRSHRSEGLALYGRFVALIRLHYISKKELQDALMEVGHGNYHCGHEPCCGKNTKARKQSTALSDAECKGYNDAIKKIRNLCK